MVRGVFGALTGEDSGLRRGLVEFLPPPHPLGLLRSLEYLPEKDKATRYGHDISGMVISRGGTPYIRESIIAGDKREMDTAQDQTFLSGRRNS